MIPSVGETAAGMRAAIRLARFDPGGAAAFPDDAGAAFRSFWAMAPVFPIYLYFSAILGAHPEAGGARWAITMGLAFIVEWCAFLLAVAQIAEQTGRGSLVLRYVAAHNWSQVAAHLLLLVAFSLEVAAGSAPNGPILFAATLYLFVYQGFIAKAALGLSGLGATGIVLLSIAIGVIAQLTARGVLG